MWLGPISGVTLPADAPVSLIGTEGTDGAGASTRFVVDTDEDGLDELWLGAPGASAGAGGAWWVRGFAPAR